MSGHTIDIGRDEGTSQGDANGQVDNNTNANTSNANTNSEVDNNTTVQRRINRNNNNTNDANNTSNANTNNASNANINNTNNANNANINNTNNANINNTNSEGSSNNRDNYIDWLYKWASFNVEPPEKYRERNELMKYWNALAIAMMVFAVGALLFILVKLGKSNQAIVFTFLVFMVFIISVGLFLATVASSGDVRWFKITRIIGMVLILVVIILAASVVVAIILNVFCS